jgi:hypothetical protein
MTHYDCERRQQGPAPAVPIVSSFGNISEMQYEQMGFAGKIQRSLLTDFPEWAAWRLSQSTICCQEPSQAHRYIFMEINSMCQALPLVYRPMALQRCYLCSIMHYPMHMMCGRRTVPKYLKSGYPLRRAATDQCLLVHFVPQSSSYSKLISMNGGSSSGREITVPMYVEM